MKFVNMELPDEENYQDDLSLPNPLDPFSASCDYAGGNYPEFLFQETTDLHRISLLDMVLSDPYYYTSNFSILQDQPVCESGVCNEITEWYSCHYEQQKMEIGEQIKASESRNSSSKRMESDSKRLSRKTISQYFYLPIAEAAKAMNVGLTLLKKRCREVGIQRWPRRKLMSLQTLIKNVQEMGKEGEEETREALKNLEREKKLLEESPDKELQWGTKRLRQACFKSNYKKRKLMGIENTQTGMVGYDHDDEFMSFISEP